MKHLSNTELDQEFAVAVKSERKITHEVLMFIQEIEKRSLHLSLGYNSLAQYLIERHHYSEGAAFRRIGAARMLTSVPEVKEKIIDGSLNLSQLSIAQTAIYKKQKEEKIVLSQEEKSDLLKELENKSLEETKSEIASTLNIEIEEKRQITYGKEDSVYINLKFTKEEFETVKECLNLLSHQAKDHKELYLKLCTKIIKSKKNPLMDGRSARQENQTNSQKQQNITHTNFAAKPRTRYITAKLRTEVFIRDQFMCQFKGKSGHTCGSKMFLQPHHIIPFAKGGQHTLENLSLRCRTHNLYEAEREGLNIM